MTSHDVDIASLLAEFHADHPAVEITLGTDDSARLIDRLRDGSLDLAIVSIGSDEVLDNISVETVTDQAFRAVVADGHPLATVGEVTLAELCQHSLITLPVGTGIRRQLDTACTAADLVPTIAFEATTPPALAELAGHGLGVAVVPETMADAPPRSAFAPDSPGVARSARSRVAIDRTDESGDPSARTQSAPTGRRTHDHGAR